MPHKVDISYLKLTFYINLANENVKIIKTPVLIPYKKGHKAASYKRIKTP